MGLLGRRAFYDKTAMRAAQASGVPDRLPVRQAIKWIRLVTDPSFSLAFSLTKSKHSSTYRVCIIILNAHSSTLKSNGMFATIIVVLPSAFEGGEVHVSHAGETKVLDVSPNSAFSTSVLAWYTDVMHEVKPVTSGYRLALSYNLIHTSPNKPQPVLPTADSTQAALRQCLQKWKDDRFSCTTGDQPLIAYLLDHQYSTNDLDRGLKALKGKDANTLSQLLPIAKDLGFAVGIGNCTRRVKGYGDDMGGEYACSKRRKYGPDGVAYEVEDDTPEMVEVDEEDYEVAHFVRIDDPSAIRFKDFSLDRESLVPEDLFGDSAPDETDYEGYQGNVRRPPISLHFTDRQTLIGSRYIGAL